MTKVYARGVFASLSRGDFVETQILSELEENIEELAETT
jgi:hypothetical protein